MANVPDRADAFGVEYAGLLQVQQLLPHHVDREVVQLKQEAAVSMNFRSDCVTVCLSIIQNLYLTYCRAMCHHNDRQVVQLKQADTIIQVAALSLISFCGLL